MLSHNISASAKSSWTYRQFLAIKEDPDTLGGCRHVIGSAGEQGHNVSIHDGHAKLDQVRAEGDAGEVFFFRLQDGGLLGLGHVVSPCLKHGSIMIERTSGMMILHHHSKH